jgi:hypothetical protein
MATAPNTPTNFDSLCKGVSLTEILWNTEGAAGFSARLDVRDPR